MLLIGLRVFNREKVTFEVEEKGIQKLKFCFIDQGFSAKKPPESWRNSEFFGPGDLLT